MIGLTNHDSSFFEISSSDVNLEDTFISKNLIRLTITEQREAMTQGSLTLYDPDDLFSRLLRTGVNIDIAWGYRDNLARNEIQVNEVNADEINGALVRRGLQAFISSPSGSGDARGVVTYNCKFTAYRFRGLDGTRVYTSGTKRDVIVDVFDRIGVSSSMRFIKFRVGADSLDTERSVRQDETDFQFLTRLAREWTALFSMGFSPDGEVVAVFMDYDQIGNNRLPAWILSATGSTHAIGYRGEINNVISYTWTSNESENGVGSNVQLDFVDGNVVFRRFVAEQETIVSYRLRPERIRNAIEGVEADGIVAQTNLVRELLSTQDFEQIEHFFDPYESTTAPQGFGYRITAEMLGNPLFLPPNQIIINNGFPDRIGGNQAKYYLDKVTHVLDKSGYKMSVEVIDAFSISDIGQGFI